MNPEKARVSSSLLGQAVLFLALLSNEQLPLSVWPKRLLIEAPTRSDLSRPDTQSPHFDRPLQLPVTEQSGCLLLSSKRISGLDVLASRCIDLRNDASDFGADLNLLIRLGSTKYIERYRS